jgi:hypothetical protein
MGFPLVSISNFSNKYLRSNLFHNRILSVFTTGELRPPCVLFTVVFGTPESRRVIWQIVKRFLFPLQGQMKKIIGIYV